MTLRLQDAVVHVKDSLHVSESDAATYVHLCMAGPSKVSDLAEALGVHRNDVYRSIERLTTRSLVEVTLERPARYVATDPLKVFDTELESRLHAIETLRTSRERTTNILNDLRQHAEAPGRTEYQIIQGRQDIAAERRRLIESAKRSLLLVTTAPHDLVLADYDGTTEAFAARAADALDVRCLVSPSDDATTSISTLGPRANVRRIAPDHLIRFVIADDHELLLHVVNDGGRSLYAPSEVALLTTAQGLVEAERLLFEQCWRDAPALPAPAAPALQSVRPTVAGTGL